MTTSKAKRGFVTGGVGVYVCDSCGKRTRDTGAGEQEGVCAKCYGEAGFENEHNDNGGTHYIGLGYKRDKMPDDCPLCRAESKRTLAAVQPDAAGVAALSGGMPFSPSGEVHPGVELAREPEPVERPRCGFSPAWIAALCRNGTIRAVKLNSRGSWRIDDSDVNRVCQSCGAEYPTLQGLMGHLDGECRA